MITPPDPIFSHMNKNYWSSVCQVLPVTRGTAVPELHPAVVGRGCGRLVDVAEGDAGSYVSGSIVRVRWRRRVMEMPSLLRKSNSKWVIPPPRCAEEVTGLEFLSPKGRVIASQFMSSYIF
ncbi:hypothetical protein E2C01_013422 [Portunus trituberculatus]|uniref:Uncharacterized protein n=1 Tax=Portunus trituberculatus TaxID=210409 RepID=A0A5B7DH21_PORTR|nr:hypothetical protein [Portunus trituberculatus]